MKSKLGLVAGLLVLATVGLVSDSMQSDDAAAAVSRIIQNNDTPNHNLVFEYASIARDAYIYSQPLLESYRVLYQQMGDPDDASYIGSFNNLKQSLESFADSNQSVGVQGWLDLRSEPMLLHLPDSFASSSVVKVSDLYGDTVAHWQGSESGGKGGNYLVASVNWQGEVPLGISGVIRSRSDLVHLEGRSLAASQAELVGLMAWHNRLALLPLSAYTVDQPPAASVALILPEWRESRARSVAFIPYVNFMLSLVQPLPAELEQLQRFERIGIVAGLSQAPRRHNGAIAAGIEHARQLLADTSAEFADKPAEVATIRPI